MKNASPEQIKVGDVIILRDGKTRVEIIDIDTHPLHNGLRFYWHYEGMKRHATYNIPDEQITVITP